MLCYECSKIGRHQEAVALCHHCSAALCLDHARIVTDPVTTSYPVTKVIVLPKNARVFLCDTCLAALDQVHPGELTTEKSEAPVEASVA